MYEQLKQLLSEATIHIEHDVNSTHISFSFDKKPIIMGTGGEHSPEDLKKALELFNKQPLEFESSKEQAKKEIEKIVEKTGAPKDKVVVATVPKTEKKTEKPKQADMFPDNLPKEPNEERTLERIKRLERFGFKEKGEEYHNNSLGLSTKYIKTATVEEFDRAYKQLESKFANTNIDNSIVYQGTAKAKGQTTVSGTLSGLTEEQQEMIEREYASGAGVKPISPKDAFDPPVIPEKVETTPAPEATKASAPPPPDIMDEEDGLPSPEENDDIDEQDMAIIEGKKEDPDTCKYIAANPMEQLKKNAGKPYLNKAGEVITPEPKVKAEDPNEKQELWDSLMAKCKENDIDTDGIIFDELNVEKLKEFHQWVDEELSNK